MKLKTTDPLGNIIHYYYDQERRPIISIDPTGAIKQQTLNYFGETIGTRVYIKRIPTETLSKLTGGFITPEFQAILNSLKDQAHDAENIAVLDRRGQATIKVDPELYTSTYIYDAFEQCTQEQLPVADKMPTQTVTHEFETRGLETLTCHVASDGSKATVTRRYENQFGKETEKVDEVGGKYQTFYDALARKNETVDPLGASHFIESDAFDRISQETNSLNQTTHHHYNQAERTHTIISPLPETQTILTANIFGETIESTDNLHNSQYWSYSPDGKITEHVDELGCTTTDNFNLLSWHTAHEDASGILTNFDYNGAGQLVHRSDDVDGLDLPTNYIRDAMGRAETIIDPLNIRSETTFDRRGKPIETLKDPGPVSAHLNLLTKRTYNGQGVKASQLRGDKTNPNQSCITFQLNGLNQDIGNIIDPKTPTSPDGLAIITVKDLDAAGKTISSRDPNGNITRLFYDLCGRERFKVDPLGGVSEKIYDAEGQLRCERTYQYPIDPALLKDKTSLNTLVALVKPSGFDTVIWHFYDENGRECFQVSGLGAVQEKRYNKASQQIQLVRYASPIDPSLCPSLTTGALAILVSANSNANQDRKTYFVLDEAGQQRFIIDALGYVTEQQFDSMGRVVIKTRYAKVLKNPAQVALLPPAQVYAELQPNSLCDRTTYQIFDSMGKPQFTVEPEGKVTRFDHDGNGNLVAKCDFAKPILPILNYDEFVKLLQTLMPNPEIDSITQYQYDHDNHLIQTIDALQNVDYYQRDALGNILFHIDRAENTWNYVTDPAQRQISEITPDSLITLAQADPNTAQLSYTQTLTRVEKKTVYDKAGNITQVIEAKGSVEERTITSTYNACNKLLSTSLSAAVDDPSKPASFIQRPEVPANLTTQTVYNAKQLEVAHQNEAGQWTFKIYDADNRTLFQVDESLGVIGFLYNTFGEPIKETRYDSAIKLDISEYTKKGIPLSVLEACLQDSPNNRLKISSRDQRGDCVATKQGPVFYYLANSKNPESPQYGEAFSQTREIYNAFRESFYQAKLNDPLMGIWEENIQWLDRTGEVLAESCPVYGIKRYKRNVFGKETWRKEFAKSLNQAPTIQLTLAELDQLLITSKEDRIYLTGYNQLRQKISDTRVGIIYQTLTIDFEGKPLLVDGLPEDLERSYQYTATQLPRATKNEQGGITYTYYDGRGLKMAETDVPRDSLDINNKPITLTPFTSYGVNMAGQRVLTIRHQIDSGINNSSLESSNLKLLLDLCRQQCTGKTDFISLPPTLNLNFDDQCEIKLYDTRGLTKWKQDAELNVMGFTYTPTRKVARQWYKLTNWQQDKEKVTGFELLSSHIDEKRFVFDASDRPVMQTILRDNTVIQQTQSFYNTFGNTVAEGPGDGSQSLLRRFDLLGNIWATNAERAGWAITLRDLAGRETAVLRSTTDDLGAITYPQLGQILDWDINRLERTQSQRDLAGRKITSIAPAYTHAQSSAQDIPLSIVVRQGYDNFFDKTCLTWVMPQERNVQPNFTIWPRNASNMKLDLPIKLQNGRCGVDVSSLPTDIYAYEINYNFTDPTSKVISTLYTTQGQVMFDTGILEGSQSLVAVVEQNAQGIVQLTGNIAGIAIVELWQNEQKLAQVPVQYNANNFTHFIDLRAFPSGIYTVKPAQASNNNNSAVHTNHIKIDSPFTLPFTIYTQKPALQPLSREIPCEVNLATLGTHGQLVCMVPSDFAKKSVKIICHYIAQDGSSQIHEDTIAYGTDKGHYTDDEGHVLVCNTEFKHSVAQISSLSLSLQVNLEWLPLLSSLPPLPLPTSKITQIATQPKMATMLEKDEMDITQVENEKVTDLSHIHPVKHGIIHTAFFNPRLLVYITPLSVVKPPVVQCWDTSRDRLANWKVLTCVGITREGVVLDVTQLPPGYYPYTFNYYPKIAADAKQALVITHGGCVYYSDSTSSSSSTAQVVLWPTRRSSFDNWNNIVAQTDTLNNTTEFTFTDLNHRQTMTQPFVQVFAENGSDSWIRPRTVYGYNRRGFYIGTRDANNHSKGSIKDAADQEVKTILGDGTVAYSQIYDSLSRVTRRLDARKKVWLMTYNHRNQLLQQISPVGRKDLYSYNELAYRNSQMNPAGDTTYYNYDALLNVESTYLPLGQRTQMQYDRNRLPVLIIDPDNSTLTWQRDYFGNVKQHTDLIGNVYTYEYDFKYQLLHQYAGGSAGHGFYVTMVQKWQNGEWLSPGRFVYVPQFNTVPPQDLSYVYSAGRITSVTDNAHNKMSLYDYDTEGRRVTVQVTLSDGTLIRNVQANFNALGDEIWSFDTQMIVTTGYDAVRNRRHIKGLFYAQDWTKPSATLEQYNSFSSADNILIDGGILKDGKIQISPYQGLSLGYTDGFRTLEQQYDQYGIVSTILTYDDDGLLWQTFSNPEGFNTTRLYAPAGWQQSYTDPISSRQISCNQNLWQTSDVQNKINNESASTSYSNFTGTGLPQNQVTSCLQDQDYVTDNLSNYYVAYEGLQLSEISGTRTDKYGTSGYSNSNIYYDANGTINSVWGADGGANKPTITNFFNSTFNGLVLSKLSMSAYPINGHIAWDVEETRYFYNVNDQYLGSYLLRGEGQLIFNYFHHRNSPNGTYESGFTLATPIQAIGQTGFSNSNFKQVDGPHRNSRWPWNKHSSGNSWLSQANRDTSSFDSYPPPVSDTYIVAPSDTFAEISQKETGNTQYANVIATANGCSGDSDLYSGDVLRMPQMIATRDSAGDAEPYQQLLDTIIGSVYPYLATPQPKPPKKPHHSFWEELVGIVATVVACVAAPELAPIILGSSPLAISLVAAALSAMVDAAGQGVLVGLKVEKHFSLSEVLESGLEAGLVVPGGAAMKVAGGVAAGVVGTSTKLATVAAMLQYGEVAVAEQLAEMSVGLRRQFDVDNVITAMLTSAANLGIGSKIPMGLNANFEEQLAGNTLESLSGEFIASAVYQKAPNMEDFAAQALGSTIGAELGGALVNAAKNLNSELESYRMAKDSVPSSSNSRTSASSSNSENSSNKARTSNSTNNNNSNTDPNVSDAKAAAAKATRAQRWQSSNSNTSVSNNLNNTWNPLSVPSMRDDASEILIQMDQNLAVTNSSSGEFVQAFREEVQNPKTLINTGLDYAREPLRDLLPSIKESYQGFWDKAVSATENIRSIESSFATSATVQELAQLRNEMGQYYYLAAKYQMLDYGLHGLKYLAEGMPFIDVAIGGVVTAMAAPGTHIKTGFEQVGEVAGGLIGGFLGAGVGAELGENPASVLAGTFLGIASGAARGKLEGYDAYEYFEEKFEVFNPKF